MLFSESRRGENGLQLYDDGRFVDRRSRRYAMSIISYANGDPGKYRARMIIFHTTG
jgi:hypothetical protein